MKHFLVSFITYDGEHEYTEYGVTIATDYQTAEMLAHNKGLKLFKRYGWEEYCEVGDIQAIPGDDFKVLNKYFSQF